MRILEFTKQKLSAFLNPQSAIRIPHSLKHFSPSQQWVLLGLALFILGLLYFRFYDHPSLAPKAIGKEFAVEVSGEVRNPGVYLFQNPPALREAIEKAGGLKEPASLDIRETSEILQTGTLLTVSKERDLTRGRNGRGRDGERRIKVGRLAANKLLVFSIPLDLNRVSTEDLCLVPGIGASLAQEIITYREKRRAFRSVDELKEVKGIGEKKWKTIRSYFIVTQPIRDDLSKL